MEFEAYDLRSARKVFSTVGFALCAIVVAATVLQLAWVYIPLYFWGSEHWMLSSSWGMWLGSFLPQYLIAFPLGLLILSRLPKSAPQEGQLSFGGFMTVLPICICLMYAGNIIGNVLSMLFSGGTAQNAIVEYAMDTNPLKILVMVILAPLLEELIFRRQIIDRTRVYGEKTAVLLSAVTFGLIHQNLFQFFYAFALGLVFAYIYVRTGRLRYSVLLHAIINFMGSVLAPFILSLMDQEALLLLETAAEDQLPELLVRVLPGMLALMAYAMVLLGLAVTGLVLLILKWKSATWQESPRSLPKGKGLSTVYLNVGMLLFIALCVFCFVLALL